MDFLLFVFSKNYLKFLFTFLRIFNKINRFLNKNFKLKLTKQRVLDIQSISNEGKQLYIGDCHNIVHHLHKLNNHYSSAFGFKFLNE